MTIDNTLWQTKVAARLHDPAEKALVLLRDPEGHEKGTSRALTRLLGYTDIASGDVDADNDEAAEGGTDKLDGVMQLLIDIRQQSRAKKDYSVSDLMRDRLGKLKIVLKDSKEGTTWGNE